MMLRLALFALMLMTNTALAQFPGSGQVTPVNPAGGTTGQVQVNSSGVLGGLTDTQLTTHIQTFTSSLSGAVPASGGGTTNFLRADGTWAAPTSGTVPARTVKCNNTASSAAVLDCTFIWTALTNKWYQNDSPVANINRFGDRVFIGDAVNFNAVSGDTGGADWYSTLQCSSLIGCAAYYALSQVIIEAGGSGQSGNSMNGLLSVTQNLNCGSFCSGIGGAFFAVQNRSSSPGPMYAGYFECDQMINNGSGCVGLEVDVVAKASVAGNPNPYQQDFLVGIQNACGGDMGTSDCGAAMQIVANPKPWHVGISIMDSSLANNNFGWPAAVSMRATYRLSWWTSSSTVVASLYAGNGGTINLDGSNIATNGNAGVSCSSGINTGTFRSVNGLVTAC